MILVLRTHIIHAFPSLIFYFNRHGMEKWMAQTLNSYDIQHHYWLLHWT